MVTRGEVAAYLRANVIDAATAAAMLGVAGRQGVHYYRGRGLEPVGRFGGADVFWLDDVRRIRAAKDAAEGGVGCVD